MKAKLIHLDFLIIGAQKAGTTSVHDWLVENTSISLPAIKETHFFSHDKKFKKQSAWYEAQFAKSVVGDIRGEVDPEYLFSPKASKRLHKYTDVNKFIILLREPLKRAFSQYLMSVRRGYEKLPFDEALLQENSRLLDCDSGFASDHYSYISRSLYSKQIGVYLEQFPDAEFLFIKFEDLINKEKMKNVFNDICNFIGFPLDISLITKTKDSNKASVPRFNWLRDALYSREKNAFFRKLLSNLLSEDIKLRLAIFLDKINQKKINSKDNIMIDDYIIDGSILDKIESDIIKTEKITGLCLEDWKRK